jgi:hypothetical protein
MPELELEPTWALSPPYFEFSEEHTAGDKRRQRKVDFAG